MAEQMYVVETVPGSRYQTLTIAVSDGFAIAYTGPRGGPWAVEGYLQSEPAVRQWHRAVDDRDAAIAVLEAIETVAAGCPAL